jgi:hypothetical protein
LLDIKKDNIKLKGVLNMRETSADYTVGNDFMTFYSAEPKWVSKVKKWKEKFPDDIDIRCENSDGSIVVHFPKSWFKISPKKQCNLSDEYKTIVAERMRNSRQNLLYSNKE